MKSKTKERKDTAKLLKLSDAGIGMGVSAIDDGLRFARGKALRDALIHCRKAHEELESDISALLSEMGMGGKKLNPMARIMSFFTIRGRLYLDKSDENISKLLLKGCEMGITSLEKELIQRKDASPKARELVGRLIVCESSLKKALSKG